MTNRSIIINQIKNDLAQKVANFFEGKNFHPTNSKFLFHGQPSEDWSNPDLELKTDFNNITGHSIIIRINLLDNFKKEYQFEQEEISKSWTHDSDGKALEIPYQNTDIILVVREPRFKSNQQQGQRPEFDVYGIVIKFNIPENDPKFSRDLLAGYRSRLATLLSKIIDHRAAQLTYRSALSGD